MTRTLVHGIGSEPERRARSWLLATSDNEALREPEPRQEPAVPSPAERFGEAWDEHFGVKQ